MNYTQILKYFLNLGLTGFGGPIALIQQMRLDLVVKKELMTLTEFNRAFTFVKAMPGPIALQMAVYCGGQIINPETHKKLGFWGCCLAAFGIIFPAFLMMIVLALSYQLLITNHYMSLALQGSQYAVAAIILMSLYEFSKDNVMKWGYWVFVVCAFVLYFFEILPEVAIILGFGSIYAIFMAVHLKRNLHKMSALIFIGDADFEKIYQIFKTCFVAGAFVFGTGLAAFPVLQAAFVSDLGWLDTKTFNDALTFGQMTPGPVTIATSFMGFKMQGFWGAVAAAVGIYLPPFIHIATWFPRALKWLGQQEWIESFVFAATAAVVGCILVTLYHLNQNEYHSIYFWVIFCLSLGLGIKVKRLSVFMIIVIGAVMNLLLQEGVKFLS